MKYIIEFYDEPELMEEGLSYYTCVDAPWWSASDHLIGKLTPYTEGEDFQRKKEKEFCVGAEVENEDGEYAYVLIPDYDGFLVLSMEKYVCPQIQEKHKWKCTGLVNESIKMMFEADGKDVRE